MEKSEVVKYLEELVGKEGTFNTDNFYQHSITIEKEIFPAAKNLGFDVDEIKGYYELELEHLFSPGWPEKGELYYIIDRLRELLDKVRE